MSPLRRQNLREEPGALRRNKNETGVAKLEVPCSSAKVASPWRKLICHYAMFVRFRQPGDRLQVTLVETRRQDGRVRHYHVASLGSIVMEPEIADRIAFWCEVHESLAALGNRLGPEVDKIMGALHQRIPMPTVEEQAPAPA
jgi:hypothetical protein